ncbi:hypothetical protein FISHEDRAFT_62000 [Fistulina hepatica ATCC 64428]|uniref:Uncharacterized protein n=1 Tax=Fistulina hepatica ATCC 64428 TaxID=1128425 RepID=A0A0D7A114_9AGAR|nr:hypothetical protein FISHEDRAFT_62000 [Fistulina hepatica ATCC 64428]
MSLDVHIPYRRPIGPHPQDVCEWDLRTVTRRYKYQKNIAQEWGLGHMEVTDDEPLTHLDGRAGAVVDEDLITSPNMIYIPMAPFGHRDNKANKWSIAWMHLEDVGLEPAQTLRKDLFVVNAANVQRFNDLGRKVHDALGALIKATQDSETKLLASAQGYEATIVHTLARLQNIGFEWTTIMLLIRETQRVLLEADAFARYWSTYVHCFASVWPSDGRPEFADQEIIVTHLVFRYLWGQRLEVYSDPEFDPILRASPRTGIVARPVTSSMVMFSNSTSGPTPNPSIAPTAIQYASTSHIATTQQSIPSSSVANPRKRPAPSSSAPAGTKKKKWSDKPSNKTGFGLQPDPEGSSVSRSAWRKAFANASQGVELLRELFECEDLNEMGSTLNFHYMQISTSKPVQPLRAWRVFWTPCILDFDWKGAGLCSSDYAQRKTAVMAMIQSVCTCPGGATSIPLELTTIVGLEFHAALESVQTEEELDRLEDAIVLHYFGCQLPRASSTLRTNHLVGSIRKIQFRSLGRALCEAAYFIMKAWMELAEPASTYLFGQFRIQGLEAAWKTEDAAADWCEFKSEWLKAALEKSLTLEARHPGIRVLKTDWVAKAMKKFKNTSVTRSQASKALDNVIKDSRKTLQDKELSDTEREAYEKEAEEKADVDANIDQFAMEMQTAFEPYTKSLIMGPGGGELMLFYAFRNSKNRLKAATIVSHCASNFDHPVNVTTDSNSIDDSGPMDMRVFDKALFDQMQTRWEDMTEQIIPKHEFDDHIDVDVDSNADGLPVFAYDANDDELTAKKLKEKVADYITTLWRVCWKDGNGECETEVPWDELSKRPTDFYDSEKIDWLNTRYLCNPAKLAEGVSIWDIAKHLAQSSGPTSEHPLVFFKGDHLRRVLHANLVPTTAQRASASDSSLHETAPKSLDPPGASTRASSPSLVGVPVVTGPVPPAGTVAHASMPTSPSNMPFSSPMAAPDDLPPEPSVSHATPALDKPTTPPAPSINSALPPTSTSASGHAIALGPDAPISLPPSLPPVMTSVQLATPTHTPDAPPPATPVRIPDAPPPATPIRTPDAPPPPPPPPPPCDRSRSMSLPDISCSATHADGRSSIPDVTGAVPLLLATFTDEQLAEARALAKAQARQLCEVPSAAMTASSTNGHKDAANEKESSVVPAKPKQRGRRTRKEENMNGSVGTEVDTVPRTSVNKPVTRAVKRARDVKEGGSRSKRVKTR